MNLNLFSVIAASAISATVALPASASVEISNKTNRTQTYTENTCNRAPISTPHWTTRANTEIPHHP
ncbi:MULTISPECIES: hypothetical protein [unclassified Pseudomonas]|uniref:hypothetical protein n=1 Tax=unclassified Pseudomonas TaxID=196821 RepID=UPI00092414EB|nr:MULTISPECIES: hypothetical protein [unclassified Pseudomonas]SFX02070.1 hypothetical protein SAMN03159352_00037 [Pseudomonas sp. NFACC43]SFX16324.1 hypothetical protein SAMN03159442_00760 [Pseudomonas sp. NFACC47-1]